jgi:protein SCO1/2
MSRLGRWLIFSAVAALAAILGALVAVLVLPGARDRLLSRAVVQHAAVGGPFRLVDHAGANVTQADFQGRFMLLAFGYTNSPDLAPSQLQLMASALNQLGRRGDAIAPVFVTLDPERDGSAELAVWVARFHPRLVGLGGAWADVAAMAAAWRVPFQKVPDSAGPAYAIDYPAYIYLMGPDGSYIAHFGPSGAVAELVRRLERELSGR